MSDFRYNKRDAFEKRVLELMEGAGLDWIVMNRRQGCDLIVLGLYPQIVEVKNSGTYKLTEAEVEMKERVETIGGKYWIVYDDETALAVADAVRGLAKEIPF